MGRVNGQKNNVQVQAGQPVWSPLLNITICYIRPSVLSGLNVIILAE